MGPVVAGLSALLPPWVRRGRARAGRAGQVIAVLAVLAFLGAFWLRSVAPPAAPSMVVRETHGEVTHIGAEGISDATEGTPLGIGDRIATGEDGRAVISRQDAPPIKLTPNTAVRLVAAEGDRVEMELERGQLRARVRADAPALRVTNQRDGRTRAVSSRQGAFAVSVQDDGLLSAEVEEGSVEVEGVEGVQTLAAGERVVSWPDGRGARTRPSAEPLLDVAWPKPTAKALVELTGFVDPGSMVRLVEPVVSETVKTGVDGTFVLQAALSEGDNRVALEVTDVTGRVRRAEGTIVRDSTGPLIKVSVDDGRR